MTNKMMVWMVGMIALLVFSAQSVHAQQKPSNVLIWCKNADGTSSPCTAGNSLDYDTGGGTVNQGTIGFVVPGAGGPVAAGTASAPMRVDPTGTTTQPVSASSLPLPTGAATAANQDGIIKDGTGDAGQANVTNGNVHQNISRINDVVPLMGAGNTGTGSPRVTEATDSQLSTGVGATGDAAATAGGTGSINAKLRLLTDLVNQVLTELGQKTEPANTQAISAASLPLPTGAATSANQDGIIKDGTGDTTQANVSNGNVHQNISRINDVVPLMGAGNTGTGSPRVTIATDQAALNGMGVYVEDAAETAGGNLSMAGTVRRDTAASSAGTTGDNATLNTDGIGRLWVREGSPCADHARITSAVINESTAATNEIVALNGSDLIYVCGYKWVTTAANSLNWKYGTGTDCATGTTSIEGAQPFAANGGVVENGGGYPLFIVPAGNALCLTSSAATAHGGRVTYVRTAAP